MWRREVLLEGYRKGQTGEQRTLAWAIKAQETGMWEALRGRIEYRGVREEGLCGERDLVLVFCLGGMVVRFCRTWSYVVSKK